MAARSRQGGGATGDWFRQQPDIDAADTEVAEWFRRQPAGLSAGSQARSAATGSANPCPPLPASLVVGAPVKTTAPGSASGNKPESVAQIGTLPTFDQLDTNHDGVLTREEFEAAMASGRAAATAASNSSQWQQAKTVEPAAAEVNKAGGSPVVESNITANSNLNHSMLDMLDALGQPALQPEVSDVCICILTSTG